MNKSIFWLLLLIAIRCSAQSGSQANTTGSCSPAISGSSNAKITITCSTVSTQKANQLVKLMNRILREQIDPEKVYQQLDEIQNSVGRIDSAVNPMAHVPPRAAEQVKLGKRLQEQCFSMLQDWSHERQAAFLSSNDAMQANLRNGKRVMPTPIAQINAPIDRSYVEKYNDSIRKPLEEWREGVIADHPDLASLFANPLIPENMTDFNTGCFKLSGFNNQLYRDVTGSEPPTPFSAK